MVTYGMENGSLAEDMVDPRATLGGNEGELGVILRGSTSQTAEVENSQMCNQGMALGARPWDEAWGVLPNHRENSVSRGGQVKISDVGIPISPESKIV